MKYMIKKMMNRVAVIGGGAAGMMAAGFASKAGADVTIFEHSEKLGKKIVITGKGRCNVTNACDVEEFLTNVPVNSKFLYTALYGFTPEDTINFFENRGGKLKIARGNRVFPASDKSYDIVDTLRKYVHKCKIAKESVKEILAEDERLVGVKTDKSDYDFDYAIICTGGKSYPLTGSTGDGYKFAERLGIAVTPLKPSLVPVEVNESWCGELQGLSLKNISVKISDGRKILYKDFGELLFTHFGLSGPVILSASAHMRDIEDKNYKISIDLKPALDMKKLDNRILSDFSKNINKNFSNSLDDLLPKKLIPVIINLSGIDPYKKVNTITQEERNILLNLIKEFSLTLKYFRPIEEAIITSGGISVREIDPHTMQSKKIKGLYFAGEVIDADAYTGGFNLQIAFSTGVLAAKSICEEIGIS